jgi:outer membrane protein assembly factor BamB
MRPVHLILALAALSMVMCSSNTAQLPPVQDADSEFGGFQPDAPGEEDISGEELCSVVWNKTLQTGGAISHPAMGGKQNLIMVSSGQKLYALGEAGNVEWTWPDDDAGWDWPSGAVIPPPWELYTPALSREFAPVFGTNAGFVISVDKNGNSRFSIKVEGSVSGAPAISQVDGKYWILIVTDLGAIYVIKDETQHEAWSLTGEQKLQYPRIGSQPLVGPAALYGVESMLVLAYDRLLCFEIASGDLRWEFVIDEDENQEATSNAIMDGAGNVYFVAGEDRTAEEYARSYVFKVPPEGPDGGVDSWLLTDTQTRVVSLSQGQNKFLLAGTNNAGLLSFDLVSNSAYERFQGVAQNFEMVAQPIQNSEGLIFFGAARHWLYVVTETLHYHWHTELDIPDGDLGAILWPSSPILREDGLAIYHNGNRINAVRCSDAGPADLAWPRFGANNLNSGNIADPRILEATTE